MYYIIFLGTFCPNLGKNVYKTKIRLYHFLASIVNLTNLLQKIRKNYKANSEKNSQLMDKQKNE